MKRQFITLREAMGILGVSRPTLLSLIKKGEIGAIKVGGKYLINIDRFEKTFGVKVEVK